MKRHRYTPGTAPRASSAARRLPALLLSVLILLATAAAFAAVARAGTDPDAPPPSISSGKADYAPGELVTLHGSGWTPGEPVTIVVNDDAGQTWRRNVEVVADGGGAISDQFNLPDWFVAVYTVTATGAFSGTATTTFTDGNVNIKTAGVASASVDWVRYSTTHCTGFPAASGTITAVSSGNGTGIPSGAASTESLRLSAASIAGFAFTSWGGGNVSPDLSTANPICVAGRNPTQQITLTYTGDTSAPHAASISINGGAAWTNSTTGAVTLGLSATDNGVITRYRVAETQAGLGTSSDVAVSPAEASFVRSGVSFTLTGAEAASKAVWLRVCDAANNCSDASDTIGWDKTAPAITQFDFSPAANGAGWHNSDITVRYEATDALSGLTAACLAAFPHVSGDRLQSKVISTEGTPVTISSDSCTDVAGNTAAAKTSDDFKLDKTAPSDVATALDRGPDHDGWYNHTVGWTTSGSDATSGIDSCSSGTYTGPDGSGKTVSGHCTDVAGNSSADTDSAAFDYDATAPTLNPGVSPNPVVLNGNATANPNASDGLSGVGSSSCDPVDTSSVGAKSLACTATDEAGNTGSASASYSVVYNWSGFFRPVDNLPGLNKAKAGSAIPVKFSLAGNQGMAIFMNGYPTSAPVVCGNTASADLVEETVTAGQSSLNYDTAAGQYVYVWKTNTGWANTCRTLTLKLVDGTVHQANFWFVK